MSKQTYFIGGFIVFVFMVFASALDIGFVDPTPSNSSTQPALEMYVNLSSSDSISPSYTLLNFDNSLIGWFRLEGNGTDESGNSNNASSVGSPTATTGRFGTAYQFSGSTTNRFNTSSRASLCSPGNTKQLTISAWVKPTSASPGGGWGGGIVSTWENGDRRLYMLNYEYASVSNKFYIGTNGAGMYTTNTYAYNNWYHVVATVNRTNGTIYINGNLENSSTVGLLDSKTGALLIGQSITDYPDSRGLNGIIDEVIIFNRTLSPDEVLALYNSTQFPYSHNFTGLDRRVYSFTGYTVNSTGGKNQTDERMIATGGLILNPPSLSFVNPATSTTSQENQTVVVNLSTSSVGETYSFVDDDNSLALWLRMGDDSSSGVFLDQGYYNHSINMSLAGTTNTTGRWGYSLEFNGSNYINIGEQIASAQGTGTSYSDVFTFNRRGTGGNEYNSSGTSKMSISSWVKFNSNNTAQTILAKIDADMIGWEIYLTPHGKISVLLGERDKATDGLGQEGWKINYTTIGSLNNGQWYHVVAIMDSVYNYTNIYIDGINQTLVSSVGALGFDYSKSMLTFIPLLAGARIDYSGNDILTRTQYLNGTFDDLLIFDKALTTSEVSALYNSTANQYYNTFNSLGNMNHTFKAGAVDSSGNKATLTTYVRVYNTTRDSAVVSHNIINPVTQYSMGNVSLNVSIYDDSERAYSFLNDGLWGYWKLNQQGNSSNFPDLSGQGHNGGCSGNGCPFVVSEGNFGQSFYLDGVDDFITVPFNFNSSQLTLSAWMRTWDDGLRRSRVIMRRNNYGFYMKMDDGYFDLIGYDSGAGAYEARMATQYLFNDGRWHLITGTYNGSVNSIYIDGELKNTSSPYVLYFPSGGDTNIYIGRNGGSTGESAFVDYMSDVLLFNRSLSTGEIKSLYNSKQFSLYREFSNKSGIQVYNITSVNSYGNIQSYSFNVTIDETLPNITLSSPTNATTYSSSQNYTANITDNLGIQNATFYIKSTSSSTVNSTNFNFSEGVLNSTIGVVYSVVDGTYTWWYIVVDRAGNVYSSENRTVTISTPSSSTGSSSNSGGSGFAPVASTGNLSKSLETINGYLVQGERIDFTIANEEHSLFINKLNIDGANVTISSNPINFILKIGESKKFNLTNSNYYDLIVSLKEIKSNKANLIIQKINEKIPKVAISTGNVIVSNINEEVNEKVIVKQEIDKSNKSFDFNLNLNYAYVLLGVFVLAFIIFVLFKILRRRPNPPHYDL